MERAAFVAAADRSRGTLAIVLCLAVLAAAPAVQADPGDAPAAATIDDREVAARIDWIQRRLDEGSPAAQRWWWSWTVISGVSTVAQGVAVPLVDDHLWRVNLAVGAGTSLVGLAPMLIFPMRAAFAADELRFARSDTPATRRLKLARAERLLRESAEGEAFGRSFWSHALGGVVAVAGGLVLWLGFNEPESAIVTTAFGLALSEVQIWTQPMAADQAWRLYIRNGGVALRF